MKCKSKAEKAYNDYLDTLLGIRSEGLEEAKSKFVPACDVDIEKLVGHVVALWKDGDFFTIGVLNNFNVETCSLYVNCIRRHGALDKLLIRDLTHNIINV